MSFALPLSQAELLKVGPISSRSSLRLLPLSKKKKKVRTGLELDIGRS
jgi:hypothetical protein